MQFNVTNQDPKQQQQTNKWSDSYSRVSGDYFPTVSVTNNNRDKKNPL